MGYYTAFPRNTSTPKQSIRGQLVGQFLAPGLSAEDVEKIVKPMEEHIVSAEWGDPVYVGGTANEHSSFSKWWAKNVPQAGGYSGRLGSRLLDSNALTSDFDALKSSLKASTPSPWLFLGHFTAGSGTHSPPDGIPGGSNAVGPGWRSAYTHIGKSCSPRHDFNAERLDC